MSKPANFFAIGLFVIGAFIIGIASFLVFSSASLYKRTDTLVATFRESTNGLREGAKVKAYGVDIGQVKRIMLHRVEGTDEIVIPVLMEIDMGQVSNLLGFRTYGEFLEKAGLDYLERDLQAKLQLESFLTGVLYVELVIGDGSTGYVLPSERFAEYRAVPSSPTDMQVLIQSIQSIAQNLGKIDFASLVEETSGTLKDIRTTIEELNLMGVAANMNNLLQDTRSKINSPELAKLGSDLSQLLESMNRLGHLLDTKAAGTLDQLERTLASMESTSQSARSWLDPSSAVYAEVMEALDQIAGASRALRLLVEYIERNPNALLTGRPPEKE